MRSAVAFVAALSLVITGCAATPSRDEIPTATAPVASAAPPAATPTPAPTQAPSPPQTWSYAGGDPVLIDRLGDQSMEAVTTDRDRFVVVGSGPRGAVSWASRDGTSWTRSGDVPSSAGYAEMLNVASTGTSLVASGRDWSFGDAGWAPTGSELWTSADGRTWESVGRFPGDEITALGVSGSRLVAVGVHLAPTDQAAFWSSGDGREWRSGVIPGGPSSRGDTPARVDAVAASPDLLVAAGTNVWVSTDGQAWAEGPLPGGMVEAADVAVVGDAFFLTGVGDNEPGTQRLWTSRDGRSWTRSAPIPVDETIFSGLVGVNGLLLLLGSVCAEVCQPAVWTSADGAAWAGPAVLPGAPPPFSGALVPRFLHGAGAIGDRYVAVGSSVWIAPATNGASPTPAPTPTACPGAAADLTDLALMDPPKAVDCLGHRSITITGYRYEGECACGVGPPRTPSWLADVFSGRFIQALPGPARSRVLSVHFDPAAGIPEDLPGNVPLTITGHFDDPAAQTCRSLDGSESRDAVITACRQAFVVTELHPGSGS
jgi:hypothetical protein